MPMQDQQAEVLKQEQQFPRNLVHAILKDANEALGKRDALLARCAMQFRKYEAQHNEKARIAHTEGMNGSMSLMHDEKGSLAKAQANADFAREIENLLKEAV